jgi:hypothetical protein
MTALKLIAIYQNFKSFDDWKTLIGSAKVNLAEFELEEAGNKSNDDSLD